jgi:hypothetical protein
MGTLYLVDAFDNVISASAINDTVNLQSGSHPLRGSFIVNLPFDVPLDGVPTDLSDLVTKKYAGMLSTYPGYANIIYDEQLDSLGWQTAYNVGTGLRVFGSRKTTAVGGPVSSSIVSSTTALGTTPAFAIFRWELFSYQMTDVVSGTVSRTVTEEDTSLVTASVSFNGSTSFTVSSGVPFEVPFDQVGSNFKVTFLNALGPKLWVGSWALVY